MPPDPSTSEPHPPPDPIQATLDERVVFAGLRRRGLAVVTPDEDSILRRDEDSWSYSISQDEVERRLEIAHAAQTIRANVIARVQPP